jgi:acyl-homoserine-lactone acylase
MKHPRFFQVAILCLVLFVAISLIKKEDTPTSITWDEWGVPHISAQDDEQLMYAEGWAQMQLHANLIVELYGRSRGKAAEYWGKNKIGDDQIIHTLGFPEIAEEWSRTQDPEFKKLSAAFVKGLNDYAAAHPESIKPINKAILPLEPNDVNMHLLFIVYTRFVGGDELGMTQEWKDMGSNTWAVGPSKSASGKAMLVQNPHLPWFGEFLFTEMHLMKPGQNMYGSTLVGLPGLAIAFNDFLGWSHTNNTIDNADTYEVQLKDGGYLLDGERKEFEKKTKTIKVKNDDGSLSNYNIELMKTVHGPVVNIGKTKALAIRMPGYDKPNIGLQWWRMANAQNFDQFEAALKMAQIPFWNVSYADKQGNIFYLFNGLVPKRSSGDWNYWNKINTSGKQEDIWTTVHSYSDLPKIKNPKQGWLQNANDPPWTSTFPMILKPADFPPYMAPKFMHFRAQRSADLLDKDPSITFDELVEYKLSTRLEMADRILDDLFKAIDQYGTAIGKEAKGVLEKWDRKADANSIGTYLFVQWANKMQSYNGNMFAVKWNENNPRLTPDGLSDPKNAVIALEETATKIKADFGTLSVPWGKVYRIHYNNLDLDGNGADGGVGAFRVAWPFKEENNISYIGGGDSWVGVIEFGDKIKANVLLSYGNSTQENAVHNGDQLRLFSRKELREAYFYPSDVEKHKKRKEVMIKGQMKEDK